MSDLTKVSFDFTDSALSELEAMTKALDSPSREETIRWALSLLSEWLDKTNKGFEVVYTNDTHAQVVRLSFKGPANDR